MCSVVQVLTRFLFFLVVFFVVTQARPVSEIETDEEFETIIRLPLINAHVRESARKRHAEIRLSTEIGKKIAEMKRLQALRQLMADLDTSNVYTVQNSSSDSEKIPQTRKRHTTTNAVTDEIHPTTPSLQEVAPHLLQQLNGQELSGGVRIKIINGNSPPKSPSQRDFRQMLQNAQNAVALAKTCQDMQEMISRNNLRLRVRCRSEPANTSGRSNLRPRRFPGSH